MGFYSNTFTIKLPIDLSVGDHTFYVIASEYRTGYKTNLATIDFRYYSEYPTLTISNDDNVEFTKNNGQKYLIQGSLSDADPNDRVKLYYQINGYSPVMVYEYETTQEIIHFLMKLNFL